MNIGGVPEHFNYPWHVAQEHGLFADAGLTVAWHDYPGGTGAMCRDLREGALDLAVVLTEGAVADIVRGSAARLVGTYVASPLTWGIHVDAGHPAQTVASLADEPFAISRYGSGSHLMSYVLAQREGWDSAALRFEVVKNFEGARVALAEGRAGGFLWEKYTTKPTVDGGAWRRVGEIPTPWPCFMLMATPSVKPDALARLLAAVRTARALLDHTATLAYIAERYRLDPPDVAEWYAQTRWLIQPEVSAAVLTQVQQTLRAVGVIDQAVEPAALVAAGTALR